MQEEFILFREAHEMADELLSRQKRMMSASRMGSIISRATRSLNQYYGRFFQGNRAGQLARVGEQSELVGLGCNHLRNILQHLLSLVTSNRLAFDCIASTTDTDSLNATKIGNSLLDTLFYQNRLDSVIHSAVELGLIQGTAFVSVEWDPTVKLLGVDGEGAPTYAGAPRVKAHSIYDVQLVPHIHDFSKQPYVVLREIMNRWDLVELFPHMEEEIKALPKIQDLQRYDPFFQSDEDHVFLFKMWARECPSLPAGRETWFCEGPIVLRDGPNPYCHPSSSSPHGGIPLFCFRPSIDYGSAFGHTVAFDLMPVQDALIDLDSAIMTNQDTHAISNIISPRTSNLSQTDLAGGSKLLEFDPIPDVPGGGKPEVLNLTYTPPEVFNYRKELITQFEVLSGVNAVLRGQPQASLLSGTALALVATQASAFNSQLENNYAAFVEEIAYFLLYAVSRFQATEEIVALVGRGKSGEVKAFKGAQLNPIRGVKVSLGNALARTTAGKIEIAELLTKSGVLKTADAVLEAVTTGNIVNVLDNATAEATYIKAEAEQLLSGEVPPAIALDNHHTHILEHRSLLFSPMVRKDPTLLQNILTHIQQHMDLLDVMAAGNPTLLAITLGAPIPMPVPDPSSGVGPQAGGPGASGGQPEVAEDLGKVMSPGQTSMQGEEQLASQALGSAQRKLEQLG